MEGWLVEHGIEFDEGPAGIKAAFARAQNRCRAAAQRERERQAHLVSGTGTPLPSSVARMARAQPNQAMPVAQRPRNADNGRVLLGLKQRTSDTLNAVQYSCSDHERPW